MGILETKFTALRELVKNQVNYHRRVLTGLSLLGVTLTPKVKLFSSWMNSFAIYGYGAKRQIGTGSWSEYRNNDSAHSLFEVKSELINVTEWMRNIKLAASMPEQSKSYSELYDKICKLLKSGLLPQVNDIDMQPTKQLGGIEVTFHTPDGWIPLESLGLGYQTMIAWTVDFAARMVERYPDSPQPLHEPAIVLVDELDLHLHPRWQRDIIDFLSRQFPKTQFIVTAHSPLVVQAAQDVNANIVLLRREGDHVVIDQNVALERNLRVDQLLTSEVFGLKEVRSPKIEKLLKEQRELLMKAELTPNDEKRIQEIDNEIGWIPTAESKEDREAMAITRKTASLLEKNGKTSSKSSVRPTKKHKA